MIEPKKLAIVGSPNVDKSIIFNTLTKRYVSVSNYPGTTVEVMRGKAGLSLVLDLNFMDEAQKLRVKIDLSGFEAKYRYSGGSRDSHRGKRNEPSEKTKNICLTKVIIFLLCTLVIIDHDCHNNLGIPIFTQAGPQ